MGIGCDVASEELVMIAFEQIRTRFGRIDVVVASAGMSTLISIVTTHMFTSQRYCGKLLYP